jgi:bla regulator protein BlaR1
MRLQVVTGETFKGYALLVSDPSRLFCLTCSSAFAPTATGDRIFALAKRKDIVAATNAGGFYDPNGRGHGGQPLGLTYSNGVCVWEDDTDLSFFGMDSSNRLIVENHMSRKRAEELHIRDGVSFQVNRVLIQSVDGVLKTNDWPNDTSLWQRTAIGQTADGTMILLVTEGRNAAYMGANRKDMIDALLSLGAVNAGMLDGGSSSLLLFPGYYQANTLNTDSLNSFQQMGLVNTYRAFLQPRAMPTFWAVRTRGG